jgi:hypothetical protein
MDSTTNYNLPLLTSSDNNTKVQDTFEAIMADDSDSAMSKIDAALKTNADVANAAIPKSIGTASDMVPVSSGVGAWTAKTLSQFKTWLSLASANISDFASAVSGNSDVSANTSARHTHSNKSTLDATTASYTSAEKTKLSGIETGAQANTVTSVAGKTGAVTLEASDVGARAAGSVPVDDITGTLPVAKGGTGAATAAGARENLGVNDAIQSAIGDAMAASY